MANDTNFKLPNANLIEEYDIIDDCEEWKENTCQGTERKKSVTTNSNWTNPITSTKLCNDARGHNNIPKKSASSFVKNLDSIMEQIDGNFGIQISGSPEKHQTTSHTIMARTEPLSNAVQEAATEHDFYHVGYCELGIHSEKETVALRTSTIDGSRVPLNTILYPEENEPPKMPGIARPFCEKLDYIQAGMCWIKHELKGLREVDQRLIETFRELLSQSRRLKRVKDTFEEQREILEEMDDLFEKEEFENIHLIDQSLPTNIRTGIQRRVSDVDRYIRLGRVGRRASHF